MSTSPHILADWHRVRAVLRIVADLKNRAGERPLNEPETWEDVAEELGIEPVPYSYPAPKSRGRLVYSMRKDQWLIEYNKFGSDLRVCETLVHELAHWYQHTKSGIWLCDYSVVYYYDGPVASEQHKIARYVECVLLLPCKEN